MIPPCDRGHAERTPAAQYLRVSSEAQVQSLEQQSNEISSFALDNGYVIVRTFVDAGRSGLRVKGRDALLQLLSEVVAGNAIYRVILVQDVSRWGRFQDIDEGAHYEFLCRSAGVDVVYCRDSLPNADVKAGAVFKAMKRVLAAEFSRELSTKIRRRQFMLAGQGIKMGGVAGYGLRRAFVQDGELRILDANEFAPRGARIRLVRGPAHEVEIVRSIFRRYLEDGISMTAIATDLNESQIVGEHGKSWTDRMIAHLLVNPKYAGDYAFGRRRRRLDANPIRIPRHEWQTCRGALEPIVPRSWVSRASALRLRHVFLESDEMWRKAVRLGAVRAARDLKALAGRPYSRLS